MKVQTVKQIIVNRSKYIISCAEEQIWIELQHYHHSWYGMIGKFNVFLKYNFCRVFEFINCEPIEIYFMC